MLKSRVSGQEYEKRLVKDARASLFIHAPLVEPGDTMAWAASASAHDTGESCRPGDVPNQTRMFLVKISGSQEMLSRQPELVLASGVQTSSLESPSAHHRESDISEN